MIRYYQSYQEGFKIFKRERKTYDLKEHAKIIADPADPLVNISGLIPDNAIVLDIGCGNGSLGRLLKNTRKDIVIDGIEPDLYAAELARPVYRSMYRGAAQDRLEDIGRSDYDYIILADVLEHMQDPLDFLVLLAGKISEKTKILISIPNIVFGAVRLALMNGKFDYVDSGLIERTHLRFFTEATVVEMMKKSGLNIDELRLLIKNFFISEIDVMPYRFQFFDILKLLSDRNASAYQFLIVASKNNAATKRSSAGRSTSLLDYVKCLVKGFLCRS